MLDQLRAGDTVPWQDFHIVSFWLFAVWKTIQAPSLNPALSSGGIVWLPTEKKVLQTVEA